MKLSNIAMIVVFTTISFFSSSSTFALTNQELYTQSCNRCHAAHHPSEFSSEEWPELVRSMRGQAALSPADEKTIVDYLTSQSSSSGSGKPGGSAQWGGYLYTEYFQTKEEARNFDLHYLAVAVSGWANESIAYLAEFELEHGGKGDNTSVEQAYIDYWFERNIALKIGAILTPFNRFDEFHQPLTNVLITRPQVSREIGVSAWKDVGVNLHGFVNINSGNSLGFDIYGINGLGAGKNLRSSRHYRDNNEDIALGGRAILVNSMGFEIGGSVYNGEWDDKGNYDVNIFGAHFILSTDIADFYGEFSASTSENPPDTLSVAVDGEMSGYFIQVSKLIDKKYRPTIRYGSLDYLDKEVVLPRKPYDKQLTELALGFAYYPSMDVVFKIEYTIYTEGNRVDDNKDNNQLGLQAAIKF